MTTPTADQIQAWRAEAVRHRVLRRVLPAQRHEVLGPLTAQKLLLAATRRQLSGTRPENTPTAEQIAGLAEMQLEAQKALTALRLWDDLVQQLQPAAEVMVQVDGLARQWCAMAGLRLEMRAEGTLPPVEVPLLHYLLLALLLHAVDTSAPGGRLLCVGRCDGQAMVFSLVEEPAVGVQPAAATGAGLLNGPVIDADDLAALATQSGWVVSASDGAARSWQMHGGSQRGG